MEEVCDRRRPVQDRRLGLDEGEVEIERSPAAWSKTSRVVGVGIFLGNDVVAASCDRQPSYKNAIGSIARNDISFRCVIDAVSVGADLRQNGTRELDANTRIADEARSHDIRSNQVTGDDRAAD